MWRRPILSGVIGGIISLLFMAYAFSLNVTGHGTTLILWVYLAFGIGLVAIPLAFASAAVARSYLPRALVVVVIVTSLHLLGAIVAYNSSDVERSRFSGMGRSIKREAMMFAACVALSECVPFTIIVVRLSLARRREHAS